MSGGVCAEIHDKEKWEMKEKSLSLKSCLILLFWADAAAVLFESSSIYNVRMCVPKVVLSWR